MIETLESYATVVNMNVKSISYAFVSISMFKFINNFL